VLIAGTGESHAQRSGHRRAAGAAPTPAGAHASFFKPEMTTEAFVRHYTAVADASPVPVLLYNYTAVTGVKLKPDAVAAMAKHQNVIGAKESGGDIAQISEYVARTPEASP
jgi:4-hydroxy-2-oxoglutarate aldolase